MTPLRRRSAPFVLALLAGVSACDRDRPVDADVVAYAGALELRVDDLVRLLADREEYPARADVVEGVAELWIDYALLARLAEGDSALASLDLRPVVRARLDQEMLLQLGDSALQVDTVVTPEQLRSRYDREAEPLRFRASHILMTPPLRATDEQRDSVRTRLEDLRRQIEGGASFEELARRHSQDPGTAPRGGDLGSFAVGEMMQPFEEAVLALEPGRIGGVVETPMGFHLVRLDERQRVPFEDLERELRGRILAERATEAESLYVAGLEERAGALRLTDDAVAVLRELAADPSVRLSGRAERRPLVEWSGARLTRGRVLEVIRFEEPGFQQGVADAEDAALEEFLLALARRELLVSAARDAGLLAPEARTDSLAAELRTQVAAAVRRLGLHPLDRAPGEAVEPAARRAALGALDRNLSGAAPPFPLGPVRYDLRAGERHAVEAAGVGRVVLRIGQIRAGRGLSLRELGVAPPAGPGDGAEGP